MLLQYLDEVDQHRVPSGQDALDGHGVKGMLEDPAAAEGTEDERLAVFRRILGEISARMKPFIVVARRDAGLATSPVQAG